MDKAESGLDLGLEGEDRQMGAYVLYFHVTGKEGTGVFCREGSCGSCSLRQGEMEAQSLLVCLFISEHVRRCGGEDRRAERI